MAISDDAAEEVDALCGIYGDDMCKLDEMGRECILYVRPWGEPPSAHSALGISPPPPAFDDESSVVQLQWRLPDGYPVQPIEDLSVTAPFLTSSETSTCAAQLLSICRCHTGSVCIYALALWLQTEAPAIFEWSPPKPVVKCSLADVSQRCSEVASGKSMLTSSGGGGGGGATTQRLQIVSGPIVVFKKSKFQAHVCSISKLGDVAAFRRQLFEDTNIASATHNITAYTAVIDGAKHKDCDDDGEDAAGGRLQHLLHVAGCSNVMVVVTRWYGGVLLGPVRFKCILNTARDLLVSAGYILQREGGK